MVKKNFRLPRTVWPRRYEITLTPDLKQFTFSGSVDIQVDVKEPVDRIVVNARELEIQEAVVTDANGTSLTGILVTKTKANGSPETNADGSTKKVIPVDEETELATIRFEGRLAPGAWTLSMKFTGIHNDKLKGFYRSTWTDKDGKKHPLVATQFESTDARRCFPCFDEPEFKATFKSTLIIDGNLTAISNTPIESESYVDDGIRYIQAPAEGHYGKKKVVFEETPLPLSSYLVAYCVGEFVSSTPVFVNGVEIRVWTVPGKENLTDFAVECAARAVAYYERRNESKFPGRLINEVAIPDFASGAMENWGCITYRETALLCDRKTATYAELKRVAEVVFHEHGHMDFGDKCTMKWWNGLWLNESFATHGENQALSEEFPDWNVWEEFALSRAAAMRLDSLNSTHPIECPVDHPDEVAELFDLISYEKGCSVLYQIQQFIGDEVFRQGVAEYIRRHAFQNTETHDLWDALEWSCKKNNIQIPVRKIMDAWVFTSGHPVVSVKSSEKNGFIELSQKPFKFLPEGDQAQLWPVPITLSVKHADGRLEVKKFILERESETHLVGANYQWVKVNAGGSGFYRVRYAPELMEKLTADVQNNLSIVERFNLVNDTWAGVRAGITSTPEYLSMVKHFDSEMDPNVWSLIIGSLRTLHSLLSGDARAALQKQVRELVGPTFKRLGYSPVAGESVQTRELRGSLLGVLGTIGEDAEVRGKAKELFGSWKKEKTSIDSNLLPAVVSTLAYAGDKAQYDEFFNLFKTAKTPQEEQRFLFALAAFRDLTLLKQTIDSTLSENVRTQDAPYLVAALLRNEVSAKSAWDFMREKWSKMIAAFPDNSIPRMVSACDSLDTPELEAEVSEFFAKNPVKQGEMATAQMKEQLRINVRLRQSESPKLSAHVLPAAAKKEPATTAASEKK